MTDKIAPGSKIQVKIVKRPTSAAAVKTLVRLLNKDAGAQRDDLRLRQIRKQGYAPQRRGGRLYGGQLVKQHPLKGQLGESGTLTASLDVLRDLQSVSRFVEVSKA